MVHKPYSQSAGERFHRPTRTFTEGPSQGSVLFPLPFRINNNDLLAEIEKDTFMSAYAVDLMIARCARNKDMIVASLQPEVDIVVAWSNKA